MQTALTLTQKQIDRLLHYAKERLRSIEAERVDWLKQRDRHESEHEGVFSHREGDSLVFAKSNESLRVISAGVDYITARRVESLFKVEPWMSAEPRTKTGQLPEFAEALARHFEWKLSPSQMAFKKHAEEVIQIAGVIGECVSKVVYDSQVDEFERIAAILHGPDGQPVVTQDGDFIFQENGTEQTTANDATGTPFQYEHPANHPEIALDQGYTWQEKTVTDTRVRYVGARPIALHRKEFFCPIKARSIQEADFVAHVTPMRLSALRKQLDLYDTLDAEGNSTRQPQSKPEQEFLEKLVAQIKSGPVKLEESATAPKESMGESKENISGDGDPEFAYVEAYMDIDPRQDGRSHRIYFCFARDYDVPIYWEYLANITPDGAYPFNAVVNNKVPLRWYGQSWYQKYAKQQDLIDKLLNQIIYRNAVASNPIKFRRKEAVVQWQNDQPFEASPDLVLDLNDGFRASDALQIQEIPELDTQTKFLLETSISQWRTSSGISTATDSSFGSMPAENTATGTQRIVASGNTLFEPLILEVTRGLESELQMLAKVQYSNQQTEEFSYRQNNEWIQDKITPEMVRSIDMVISLKLSNLHATQKLQQAQQAIQVADQFMAVPTPFKGIMRPLFEQIFQSLQIDNASELLGNLIQLSQQMEQSQHQGPPVKLTESLAFKDLGEFPEAQMKLLVQAGVLDEETAQQILQRKAQETNEDTAPNSATPLGNPGGDTNPPGDLAPSQAPVGPGTPEAP